MKIILKIILMPISLILSLIVNVSSFLVSMIGGLLNVISFILFLCALLLFGMALFDKVHNDYWGGLFVLIAAFIISPYGLPKLAAVLVVKLDDLNDLIKNI